MIYTYNVHIFNTKAMSEEPDTYSHMSKEELIDIICKQNKIVTELQKDIKTEKEYSDTLTTHCNGLVNSFNEERSVATYYKTLFNSMMEYIDRGCPDFSALSMVKWRRGIRL